MGKVILEVRLEELEGQQQAVILFHPDLRKQTGKTAEVKLVLSCRVEEASPINKNIEKRIETFTIQDSVHTFRCDLSNRFFTYEGSSIQLVGWISVDVGSARFVQKFEKPLRIVEPEAVSQEEELERVSPPDEVSYVKNFFLLPTGSQFIYTGLFLATLFALWLAEKFLVTSVLRMNDDQMEMALMVIVLAGFFFVYLWARSRSLFKPELGLRFKIPGRLSDQPGHESKIDRESRFQVSDWLKGAAEADLHGARLRVVAGNIEKGRHVGEREVDASKGVAHFFKTSNWKKNVVKESSVKVRPLVLYDKTVERLPRGSKLAAYFNDPLDLRPVFTRLYPPDLVATGGDGERLPLEEWTHGLGYYLEFQFLHPTLVDVTFEVSSSYFDPLEFYRNPGIEPPVEEGNWSDHAEEEEIRPPDPPGPAE